MSQPIRPAFNRKGLSYAAKELVFGGKRFCCCIPTRFGVIAGSLLTFIVAGVLAVILWFEVATQHDMRFTETERRNLILAGVLEILLFLASILGFIGGIVRKQLFIAIYCYFLYIHFLVNLGVGIYLLFVVNHTTNVDITVACNRVIENPGTQKDCSRLLNDLRAVFNGAIICVLLMELYGALVVTRYLRQLKREKTSSRLASDEFGLKPHYYSNLGDDDENDALIDSAYHPRPLSSVSQTAAASHFPVMPQAFPFPSPEQEKHLDG